MTNTNKNTFEIFCNTINKFETLNNEQIHNETDKDCNNFICQIIENYHLTIEEKITLLKKMKEKDYDFSKEQPKKIISSVNFSNIMETEENNEKDLYMALFTVFQYYNEYYLGNIAYKNPSLIEDIITTIPEPKNKTIKKEDIIKSFFYDTMFKHLYAHSGSDKYSNIKEYLKNIFDTNFFTLQEIQNAYLFLIKENKFKISDKFKKIMEDLKPFILNELEKEQIMKNLIVNQKKIIKKRF